MNDGFQSIGDAAPSGLPFHPIPIPWSDFPSECLWYFVPMLLVHVVLFLAYCGLVGPLPEWHPVQFRRTAVFFGLFLIAGSLFNGLWSCLVFDRFYSHRDYIFDFVPFWPFTKGFVYQDSGRLIGVTLWQLQLIWGVFAAGTWGSTCCLYRLLLQRWPLDLAGWRRRKGQLIASEL